MATPSAPHFPLRLAAIDVGSNGIRCMAVEFHEGGRHEVLLQERAAVRLGHGVFSDGSIDAAAMEAALAALAGFRKQLDGLHIEHLRAVATSAVREARNRTTFIRRAKKQAGFDIEVISGAEEARLVHLAIAQRMPLTGGSWMVMDLGGGSVEVSLVDATAIQWSESHPMGSVRVLEQFHACEGDPKRFQKLIAQTVATLRIPAAPKGKKVQGLVATGGNIEDLARIADARDPATKVSTLSLKDLRRVLEKLATLSDRERVKVFGLRPDRADVILPAGLVYEQVAKLADVSELYIPHVGVKEGILVDLLESLYVRKAPQDGKERLVQEGSLSLGRRFQFDEGHGAHVSKLALSLFDQTHAEHGLGEPERAILHAAAILHDVGRFVDDRKHHKHSYYLISQSELPGLSESETELVAQVARYHRRKEPTLKHKSFARLAVADRKRVLHLAAILRVADALDREHRQAVHSLTVERKAGKTTLNLMGEGDFALEEWSVNDKGGLFCRTFKTTIALRREAPA